MLQIKDLNSNNILVNNLFSIDNDVLNSIVGGRSPNSLELTVALHPSLINTDVSRGIIGAAIEDRDVLFMFVSPS